MTRVSEATKQVTLSIDGMSCEHCVRAVSEAVSGLASGRLRGVGIGFAEIEVLGPSAEADAIAALAEAGYSAKVMVSASGSETRAKPGCGVGPKGCCG